MQTWIFRSPSYIQEALAGSVAHGIFGYSEAAGSYFEAVAGWMGRHYGWNVEEPWLVKTPGIVFALAQAVRAFTEPGDAVLLQQPVYHPFSQVIRAITAGRLWIIRLCRERTEDTGSILRILKKKYAAGKALFFSATRTIRGDACGQGRSPGG